MILAVEVWPAKVPGYNTAMRYRLRTLLILTAIAAIVFARIGYLQRMANVHRETVASLIPVIATAESESEQGVESSIRHLAAESAALTIIVSELPLGRVIVLENGDGNGVVIQNNAALPKWRAAVRHSVLAAQYDRAIFRPWMMVSEDFAP